jgi:hypothetical protein
MTVYVGMDVHRKRSQVAVLDDAGDQQRNRNVPNDPTKLVPVLGGLPPGTPVAFEAAYGWGWLVDLLEELEAHLVHPSRCKAIASVRLKNDKGGSAASSTASAGTAPGRRHPRRPHLVRPRRVRPQPRQGRRAARSQAQQGSMNTPARGQATTTGT